MFPSKFWVSNKKGPSPLSLRKRQDSDRKKFSHWWLVGVALVVASGFLPQNFGRW